MNHPSWPVIGGLAAAIAITTTMDATGYAIFSALPLLPLTGLFWYLQRFSHAEMGLTWGRMVHYGLSLAYPILVLGAAAAAAYVFDAVETSGADWNKVLLNIGLIIITGSLIVLMTVEGFFRGWLWAALKRAGHNDTRVLFASTIAFTAWHISAISLDTGFDIPANEIPIYLINATLIGAVFGAMRLISGSVVVPSVCHAVWNGIDYPLFGFGEKVGALGIQQTHIFGPEVGLLGIALNLAFLTGLWLRFGK